MDFCSCTPADCVSCPDKVVCHCLQVTEGQLVQVIQTLELRTVKEVRRHTGAGAGCMCCHARIKQYLATQSCSETMQAIAG
jgi:bacterioferritin-associated ferredoxin